MGSLAELSAADLGVSVTRDLLQRLTGGVSVRLEAAFQMFTPTNTKGSLSPAYIREINGDLVIPLKSLENPQMVDEFAVLGYDPAEGRILVKFHATDAPWDGTLPVKKEDACLIIPANMFVSHHGLAGSGTNFDVTMHNQGKYLMLSPREID